MKKKIYLLLCLMLTPTMVMAKDLEKETVFYRNQNGIKMTEHEVTNLKNLAFTDEQISYMDLEEFDKNKNLVSEIESISEIYVKSTYYTAFEKVPTKSRVDIEKTLTNEGTLYVVNEVITEEAYERVSEDDIISTKSLVTGIRETTYKKLTTTIIKNGSYYRVRNDLTWKKMPSTRSYDVFGIRVADSNVSPKASSQYAKMTWKVEHQCGNYSNQYSTVYSSLDNWNVSSGNGYGVTMKLPSDAKCTGSVYDPYYNTIINKAGVAKVTSLGMYMYYDVKKKTTVTVKAIDAYGSYQHSTKTISFKNSLSFSIGSGGLGGVLNFGVELNKSFDAMGGTHAELTGIKW